MQGALKMMVQILFDGKFAGITDLTTDISTFNTSAHAIITNISNSAVFPIAIAVLSIVMMVELNQKAAHIEGDHQTGVKLIFSVIFKYIILAMAVKNAGALLDGVRAVINAIIQSPDLSGAAVTATSRTLNQFNDAIDKADTIDQVGMLIFLLIPFLIGIVAKGSIIIIVYMRFAELYALTAFAPLPFAFLANDETKPMGTGFLKKYVEVCLHGACIIAAALIYTQLVSPADSDTSSPLYVKPIENESPLSWLLTNYVPVIAGPVLLMMLIFGAGKIAKALVGNG